MTNIEPTEQPETMDLETAQRVEQEKMTRRAALRKLGYGAGIAAFSMLGVDDFTRMVGQRLQRMAGDNKVASQIAREFQEAGVAMATAVNPSCTYCYNEYKAEIKQATTDFSTCYVAALAAGYTVAQATKMCDLYPYCPETNNALYAYNGCCAKHCPTGYCAGMSKPPGC